VLIDLFILIESVSI